MHNRHGNNILQKTTIAVLFMFHVKSFCKYMYNILFIAQVYQKNLEVRSNCLSLYFKILESTKSTCSTSFITKTFVTSKLDKIMLYIYIYMYDAILDIINIQ